MAHRLCAFTAARIGNVVTADWSEFDLDATRALLSLPSPPTAIFCANDLMAIGCYEALREAGLRIPHDFAVMGYDDREIAQHLHPPLSTVVLPHYEMASIAAKKRSKLNAVQLFG